jgi:DNA invertase Pin-like site-specific DNA recombinase
MTHFLVYVRRSYRTAGDADVSDEAQIAAAVAMLPAGATHEVIADSGGHRSGRTAERDGYQELVARVRDRRCDGIAVYDVSRLARNARLLLELHAGVEAAGIPLLIANMPNTRWDTATGRFMLGQLALAAQFQADMDSERARSIRAALYEDGRHRGQPPFGYRNGVDGTKRRILVVDEVQADVVRRIFAGLAQHSFAEVAAHLTANGAPAPTSQGWTRYVVREIYLRAKVYLGLVVDSRRMDERPGRHTPIITPELHRGAIAGMAARDRGGRKAGPGRAYLLAGVLVCDCRRRMVGHAGRSGTRYYWCRTCRRPMLRSDAIEPGVLDAIRTYRVTAATMDAAREELRRRLAGPDDEATGRARRRLEGRLGNLRKQHGWGDIDDATYRREKGETEQLLAGLPDVDKLVAFDRKRAEVLDLAAALEVMTEAELKQTVALFVEEVTRDGRIHWSAPFRPFFALAVGAGVSMVSPEGSDPAEDNLDALAWFTA